MEKLFLSIVVLLCICASNPVLAQNQEQYYCTYLVEGQPMLDDEKTLEKGMFVRPNNFLTLGEEDHIILMDQDGYYYEIKKKAIIPYARIKRYTKKEVQSSFSVKYLKYVWQKLWEREESENIGVVFRAPNLSRAVKPLDSTTLNGKAVAFEWKTPANDSLSYFFLSEEKTKDTLLLKLNGNQLYIPVDDKLLKSNTSYEWYVGTDSIIKPKLSGFSKLTILNDATFNAKLEEYEQLITELGHLGISREQALEAICEDVRFCDMR